MIRVLLTASYSAANGAGLHTQIIQCQTKTEAELVVDAMKEADAESKFFHYKAVILDRI